MLRALSLFLLLSLVIHWIPWAAAALLRAEKYNDLRAAAALLHTGRVHGLAGCGTLILLALLSLRWSRTYYLRQQVQTGLVTAMEARLGIVLLLRILQDDHEDRCNKVPEHLGMFFMCSTLLGMVTFVSLLPCLLLNLEKRNKPLVRNDYLGWTLWLVGFLIEAVADQQEWSVEVDTDNAGKCIQSDLSAHSWSLRMGEILQWSGLYISASVMLSDYRYLDELSILFPMFVLFLLNYVRGLPMNWGEDEKWVQT